MAKNKTALASIDDYPNTLTLDEKELPAIKNWKIDGEYVLDVKVKLKSLNKSMYSDSPKLRAEFVVQKVTTDDDEKDDLAKGMDSVKPQYVREKGK